MRPAISDPFEEMEQMQKSMNRLFESFFPMSIRQPQFMFPTSMPSLQMPQVELKNEKAKYTAIVSGIEGFKKEDFEIEVHPHALRIRAGSKNEKIGQEGGRNSYSGSSASFYRQFVLPEEVDAQSTKAKFSPTKLSITIPKLHKKPPKSRKIKVA